MSKQLTAVALLALMAGTAMAAPRESRTFSGPVNLWGASAAPESFTLNFTGVDGTPYTATHVQVQGTLTSNVAGTWPNDASMDITAPDGTTITAVLSQTFGTYTSEFIDVSRPITLTGSMAGDWTFTPYETFEDGDGTTPESILTDITVTMDDTPGAPNGSAATAIDLGTLVDGTNVSATAEVGAAEVLWYKFTCLDVTNAAGRKLSMGTLNSAGGDSEIAIYQSDGTGLFANDDYTGLLSFMSFGVGGTTGAELPAGTYYVPVASYPTTFYIADFNVVSDGDGGSFQLDVLQEFVGVPVAPEATDLGTLVDNTPVTQDFTLGGGEVKWFKATVADATTAANRQLKIDTLATPEATDTEIGVYTLAGALVATNDDNPYPLSKLSFGAQGENGDLAAGTYFIPVSTYNATFLNNGWNVTSNGAGGHVVLTVAQITDFPADIGDMIDTANIPSGTGELSSISGTFDFAGDVDMYKISICDVANFSASTAGTAADTQLFLFNADGTGVSSNDDQPGGIGGTSVITNLFVTAPGDYYLAISRYNIDPLDAGGNLIWANTPFDTERSPDGPGAGGALASWTGASFGTVDYTLSFTGTCYPTGGGQCSIADVGVAGGLPGHDHLLDNNDFISFITLFFANDAQADMGVAGGLPGSDHLWDNNDFIAFIGHFFDDAAACNG